MSEQQALTPETAFARLQAWFVQAGELKELKQSEVIERKLLSAFYFTTPREGTNRLDLGGGFDLKLDFSYNYKVDEADLDNVTAAQIKKLKLPWDDLFVYKPELKLSVYRDLSDEQKAFVDTLLSITDATPQLAIVPQANAAGAKAHAEAAVAALPAVHIVEDMDDAVCGSYYEDGDGQWWLCTVFDEATTEKEWEQVENPNPTPAPKPKRTRASKK